MRDKWVDIEEIKFENTAKFIPTQQRIMYEILCEYMFN
jgi:hypothetical protein